MRATRTPEDRPNTRSYITGRPIAEGRTRVVASGNLPTNKEQCGAPTQAGGWCTAKPIPGHAYCIGHRGRG